MLSILPWGFFCCMPFSSCHCHCHCHWHGEILAFASTIPLGSWFVTTTTRWIYHVPFHYLWNRFHLFSFAITETCGHHPGSILILTFSCSFYSPGMWVLILALTCTASISELSMPASCTIRCPLYRPCHQQGHWPPRHYWDLADHKGNLRISCWSDPPGFLLLSQT